MNFPDDPHQTSLAVSCAPTADNALRVVCQVEVHPASAVELSYWRAGDTPRTKSSAEATEHRFVLYDLAADTPFDWRVTAVGHEGEGPTLGTFTTGELPDDLRFELITDGEPHAPDDLLFLFGCGARPYAVVMDPEDGEVQWYQDLAEGLPGPIHTAEALTLTPEGTVLAIVDRTAVREYTFDGLRLADWRPGEALGRPIHHDLVRHDGLTWVLSAKEATYGADPLRYVTDGVLVLDPSGAVAATWDLDGFATPQSGGPPPAYWQTAFPDADIDWSHGNGLWVTEDGVGWVSFYYLDAVLEVDLQPASATFGAVRSALVGHPFSPIYDLRDYQLGSLVTSDLTFAGQHQPQIIDGGRMSMLDNGVFEDTRALVLSLDAGAGRAEIEEEYDLGVPCAYGGGATLLSNGDVLATCAPSARFFEFERGGALPIHSAAPVCTVGVTPLIPRVVPLRW